MPITKVKGPDGEIYNVSHPEGASESEIIQYAQIYGPTYDLPTITDSVGQIEQEEQEEFDRTFFGQVGESAKGVGRGFGRGLLSGLEGLAELADAATDYVGLEGLIDSGDENEIIRLARSGKDVVNKMLPTDQAYEDAWWTKFGEGLGSFGSFLVPGGAVKAVGLMPKLRALSQGGGKIREYGVLAAPASPLALGVGAQDQAERIQRARDSGVQVDDATADASVLMGGAIGLTELAPIGAVLKGLPKEVAQTPFFQSLLPRIKSALASGSLEGIQEVSARLLQDATERNMYNPNLQVGDSVWDEFTIGGSVGALADLTLNAFAGRKSYALKKEEIARIQSALEKRRKYLEEVANNPLIAQEIENIRGQSFTAMTTDPATGENILGTVVTDGSGNQIGPQFSTPQEAALFAYNLNNYVIDKSIERNIQSAVNSSGTSYSESQVNDLVNLGMKVFDLTSNTVTENALNFAFDPYLSSETSTLSAKEAIDAGVKPQDMTPAQRINAKRLNRGLPEVKEFTIPEVRSELKNNFDRIFSQQYVNLRGQSFEVQTRKKRPVVVSSFGEVIDSRPLMAEEKTADNYFGRKKFDNIEEATDYANYLNQKAASTNPEESIQSIDQVIDPSQVTVKQLESLLRQKNIDADVNSKEFRALVEHYTGIKASGKTTVDKLNQNDLALLYTKIRELPTLNQFTAIPEFKVYPYTTDHFSAAARTVMETGAMPTQEELINTVGPITKGEYDAIASDIQSNPRFQTSIETLAQETTDLYKSVQDALESSMKGFGLDDVKVNFLDSVRSARVGEAGETVFGARKERADTEVIEGSYKPSLNSVFIALDGIVADPRYRAAKESERDSVVEQLAVEILGHEVIHPARELDLFTAKEWETLSRKVGEISKGEDANYIDWSVRNYAAPGVTQETIVEEAVAEMMRDALAGKISLTGKPRSLIQRMINFIKGIVSFKNKTGYSRFEDVVEAFRVGEVGARQRGEIRTDVAIGKVEGAPIIQRPGVERQPDFIPDDEMFAKAWQGGPNKYRVADISAIGSGQGAQTFGYGLYYAEERMVADLYRKNLSAKRFKDTWQENLDLDASFEEVNDAIDDGVFSPDQVAFLKALEKYDWLGYDYVPQVFSAIQGDILSGQQSFDAPEVYEAFENLGYIYEADIKDSAIDNMLDWDVEVGSQPNVANKIARLIGNLSEETGYSYSFNPRIKGRDAFGAVKELVSKDVDFIRSFDPSWNAWWLPYNRYDDSLKGEINKKASELLNESGIRGIKYFDQGSRPAARATQGIVKPLIDSVRGTPQTQNFVVFNSGDIVTRKRNGKELVAELKKKNPELQGIQDQLGVSDEMFSRRAERAYEQGFDLDEIFYHGRLSSSDPIQSFALRPSRTPEVDVFVTALPEFADIFAEYPIDSLYDVRTGKRETNFTSTIYPLVLKRGLKFADLRDKDVIKKLRRTFDNLIKQLENREMDLFEYRLRFGILGPESIMEKLDQAERNPETVGFQLLGSLAPLIKEAGYDGYFDIEHAGQGITGRAVFDGRNVKGLFARFDPESVPEGAAYEDDMMYAKRLEGMPKTFMVDGQAIEFGYFDRALDAARSYERRSGIPYAPLTEYAPVDESRAKKIAIEYEYMEHKPDDPEVRAAYEAMAQETLEQYKDILATGLNVRFIKGEDPYGNPRNAILDIYNNNNFFVFSTKDGFGADAETTIREQKDTNPMLRDSGFKTSDGDPMLVNDVFRVVHDYFGHAKNGVGFRARGEENAWQSHASMYSPLARRAMTTETRGQNSWVNFGPEAEYNRTASPADTIYADQKIGLLPIWVSEEGRLSADSQQRANRDFTDGLEGAIDPNGRLLLTHYSTEVFERLDPSKAGTGADRIKFRRRWLPKATYYGIVKAVEDGYRKESVVAPGAGAIEYTASIDPYLIYPADKDPYNLWVPNDYRQSIRNMKDAGYSGYRSNNPSLGKVAVLWDSLPIDSSESVYGRKDKVQKRKSDESFSRRTKRSLPKDQVEQAVKKNIEEFNSSDGRAIPAVNVFASPDAQYIADNPDAALEIPKDDVVYSRRRPSFGGSVDNIIEEVGGSPLTGRTPFDSYEEASGAVASPSRLNYLLTKAKQEAVNRYARLEQLNYSTELRENLADTSSISAALQADKAMAIVSAAFKYGIPVYKNGTFMVVDDASAARLGIASPSGRPIKSLMEIMNQLFDTTVEDGDYTALAKTYAAALRTERLMRQGITKHPGKLDQSQINEIKAVVDGLTDPATGKNIVKDWYRDWQDYNTAVITMMQDAGILTDETADLWRNWSDYIPFYRFSEGSAKTLRSDVKGIGEKVFGGMNVVSQMKRLKGSEEGLNMDLIDAVTMNLTAAVQMSMKNVAQQRIARDMIQLGLAKQLRPNESGISTAEFRVNGKNTKVEIYDPLIYESMMPLNGTEMVQMVRETFGIPATFLREMITRDPGFIIANLFRDSLSTFVTSGTNMTPIVDTFASYFGDMKELEMLGVIGGYDLNALPSEIGSSSRLARLFASNKGPREFFEMETQRAGMGPKGSMNALNLFKRLWNAAGRATSRSDGATRRAVFNDVYARTGNLAEAAFQAQEIINFGRRGRWPVIRALTAVIPFLNARIQGVDVLWRGLTGRYTTRKDLNRTQVLMSALTRASLMATMTALYWALVRDDEQYEEAPDYLKDNYWIIPTPLGAPITLPVPFEVGFLFKTVPEAILDTSYGDRTNRELRETVKRGVQSTFELSPFSIQAIGPLLEAGLNYNAYTGRRIVPFYVDEKITEGFQSTAYTNQLAKIIGESMNISPLKVEHVMQGYAGTIGQYFLDFIDRSLRSDYAGEGAVLPAMRFYDYPFAKRFFGRVADRGLQEDAYDVYRQVDVVYNTIEKLKKEGKVDELFAYLKARETLLGMRGSMNNLKGYLDKVRRYKKTVIESDLSAEEKRKQIEEADMILNAALREVIPYLKNVSDMPLKAFEPLYYE